MRVRHYVVPLLAVLAIVVGGAGMAWSSPQGSAAGMSYAPGATYGPGMMGGAGMWSAPGMMMGGGYGGYPYPELEDEERPFDLQFIDQMIAHHQMAILSAGHMISDSQRPELRELAENIQSSQSEQIDQMLEWRKEWYADDAGWGYYGMGGMGAGMVDSGVMERMMGGSSSMQEVMGGDVADEMFLRMMIVHHQQAIEMSEEALERAEHPELRELAQQIIDEQQAEVEQMRGYLEEIEEG
jgi:uncharacterized protein (DUF305 family)